MISDADQRIINQARASVGRNLAVYREGVDAIKRGKSAEKAMRAKYYEQRGGGSTDRPGYNYELGGSKEADRVYLNKK